MVVEQMNLAHMGTQNTRITRRSTRNANGGANGGAANASTSSSDQLFQLS